MINQASKILQGFIVVLLVFQLAGCGTLFYPDRRGQRGGHLDAGIVVLDGLGLLFFLIPGIIAFAVDFSNGTIYLPERIHLDQRAQLMQIKFDPKHTTLAQLEQIIKDKTGRTVYLTEEDIRVDRMNSQEEMKARFAQATT